jgi:hypothetical protein
MRKASRIVEGRYEYSLYIRRPEDLFRTKSSLADVTKRTDQRVRQPRFETE